MMLSQGFSDACSPLSCLQAGERGIFYQLRGSDSSDAHLQQIGLTLGATILLVCRSPQLIIQVQGRQFPLSADLANRISVRLETTCAIPVPQDSLGRDRSRLGLPLPLLDRWIPNLLSPNISGPNISGPNISGPNISGPNI